MEKLAHWTQRSVADFVYNISSNFVSQLETRMEEREISRRDLAGILGKSNGRVSQVFNNPGNLSVRVIVEHARALGMKVSIVAYDDDDPKNENGPINPEVFVKSWEKLNRPADLFEVAEVDEKQAAPSHPHSGFASDFQWHAMYAPNVGYQPVTLGGIVRGATAAEISYLDQQGKLSLAGPFSPTSQPYQVMPFAFETQTYPLERAS
jgi:transcriptional regulator with XRE-family HTH domain